jgi:hypothetical protein
MFKADGLCGRRLFYWQNRNECQRLIAVPAYCVRDLKMFEYNVYKLLNIIYYNNIGGISDLGGCL